MIIFICLVLSSYAYSSSEDEIISVSQISSNSLSESDIYFRINYNSANNLAYGMQWWPSSNLFIYGCISPNTTNNVNRLYHKLSVGYNMIPFQKLYGSIIEFGIHRQRYNFDNKSSWYEVTSHNEFHYRKLIFNIMLTQLFYNDWESFASSLSIVYVISPSCKIEGLINYYNVNNYFPSLNLNISI